MREWPLSLHVSHAQESERQHTRERALLLCAGSAAVRATGLDFRFCTHSNTKRVESEESAVCVVRATQVNKISETETKGTTQMMFILQTTKC